MNDVKWRQRFRNFDRAFILLRSALEDRELDSFSDLEKDGVIINPVTPRNVIKEAFAAKLLPDGQVWIDMMLHRNLLSRSYDFSVFQKVLGAVKSRYLSALDGLHEWLIEKSLEQSE